VEEVRIGAGLNGDSTSFARIVDVALDPLGRVWIADGEANALRVFESNGKHVRSIGRTGGGPTEFMGIAGMDWAADGSLWVLDGGNMRFAVYDTAGRLVSTHRRSVNVVTAPWPLGFDAQGRLYDLGSVAGEDEREIIVRLGPGLQPQDTFIIPRFEDPVFEIVTNGDGHRNIERITVPFAGLQEWRVDPQGFVWIGITDRYRLERHRFGGGIDRVVERRVAPAPVTRQERRRARAGYRDFEQRGGRIDESRMPATHTLFIDFFFDEEGSLWVIRNTGPGEEAVVDVFNSQGVYQGPVRGPIKLVSSPAPVVRGNRMAAVVQDDDGVESVVVMRVEKPGH
jgi:sugar lactone lactonase YvrE